MVQSSAKTVDAYLAELPVDRRPAVARLRELALRTLPGSDERMEYGMPSYRRDEANGLAFASQVRHVSIYFGGEIVSEFGSELEPSRVGVGCVRFPSADRIDWELTGRMFRRVSEKSAGGAKVREAPARPPRSLRKGSRRARGAIGAPTGRSTSSA